MIVFKACVHFTICFLTQSSYSDYDDEFNDQDEIWGEFSRPYKRRRIGGLRSRGGGYDREALLQSYEISVLMQDNAGNYFSVKTKVRQINPNQPVFTKVMPVPLSVSWAHMIFNYKPKPTNTSYYEFEDILSLDIKNEIGTDFNCVLMDPPLDAVDILDKKPFLFPAEELVSPRLYSTPSDNIDSILSSYRKR